MKTRGFFILYLGIFFTFLGTIVSKEINALLIANVGLMITGAILTAGALVAEAILENW